jgi:hypothetical protein
MRRPVDSDRIRAFAREVGRHARRETKLYLTGGATAVLHGWRDMTVDIDVRFEPDDDEIFRAIAGLKDRLDLNVEFASPPDFIPELPGWRDRSPFLFREGKVDVHEFDFYSQALSKIERGFDHDLADVAAMFRDGLVERPRLRDLFSEIEADLFRYLAIDAEAFRRKVEQATD